MNKLLGLLALVAIGAACRHQAAPTKAMVQAAPKLSKPRPTDSLLLKRLAQTTDFSPLLQTVQSDADYHNHAQNGFFGPAHYRVEMATTQVVRDPTNPAIYHVRGLSRYKRNILLFVCTLIISKLAKQPYCSAEEIINAWEENKRTWVNEPGLFSALGAFELREDSTRRGAGIFRG